MCSTLPCSLRVRRRDRAHACGRTARPLDLSGAGARALALAPGQVAAPTRTSTHGRALSHAGAHSHTRTRTGPFTFSVPALGFNQSSPLVNQTIAATVDGSYAVAATSAFPTDKAGTWAVEGLWTPTPDTCPTCNSTSYAATTTGSITVAKGVTSVSVSGPPSSPDDCKLHVTVDSPGTCVALTGTACATGTRAAKFGGGEVDLGCVDVDPTNRTAAVDLTALNVLTLSSIKVSTLCGFCDGDRQCPTDETAGNARLRTIPEA